MAEEFVPGPLDAQDAVKPAAMPPLHNYVLTYMRGRTPARAHKTLRGAPSPARGMSSRSTTLPRSQRPHRPALAVRGRGAELDHRRYTDGRDERESGTDDGSIARGLLQRD
jgi:hypothetical protein